MTVTDFTLYIWVTQKRDSGMGTLASSSDKSSGVKSASSPSTPQADSTNSHVEARHSHSLLSDNTPADHLSDVKHIKELFEPNDNYLGQETSPVLSEKTLACSSEILL